MFQSRGGSSVLAKVLGEPFRVGVDQLILVRLTMMPVMPLPPPLRCGALLMLSRPTLKPRTLTSQHLNVLLRDQDAPSDADVTHLATGYTERDTTRT